MPWESQIRMLRASILLANVRGGTISSSIPSVFSCAVSIASASCLHLRHQPLAESSAYAGVRRFSIYGLLPAADLSLGSLPPFHQIEHYRVPFLIGRVQSPEGKLPMGRRFSHSPILLRRVPERWQSRRTGCCLWNCCDTGVYAVRNTPGRCQHPVALPVLHVVMCPTFVCFGRP